MGSRIASWSLSGVQGDTWRVYSSLLLPDGQPITTIDCKSGNVVYNVTGDGLFTGVRTARRGHSF